MGSKKKTQVLELMSILLYLCSNEQALLTIPKPRHLEQLESYLRKELQTLDLTKGISQELKLQVRSKFLLTWNNILRWVTQTGHPKEKVGGKSRQIQLVLDSLVHSSQYRTYSECHLFVCWIYMLFRSILHSLYNFPFSNQSPRLQKDMVK